MKHKSLRRDIPLSILVDLLIQIVFVMTILWVITGIESAEKDDEIAKKDDVIADLKGLPGEANRLKDEILKLKAQIKVLDEKLSQAGSGQNSLLAKIEKLKKEIEKKGDQIAKLIRGGARTCFGRDADNNHVATFYFYVSNLSDEIEEIERKTTEFLVRRKKIRNLDKRALFRIHEWKDYEKFNSPSFLKNITVEIPDRWINTEEFNEFNLRVSKVARENNCKLRVRILGLDSQQDIWDTHRDKLFSKKYFYRVNRTKLSFTDYDKAIEKFFN